MQCKNKNNVKKFSAIFHAPSSFSGSHLQTHKKSNSFTKCLTIYFFQCHTPRKNSSHCPSSPYLYLDPVKYIQKIKQWNDPDIAILHGYIYCNHSEQLHQKTSFPELKNIWKFPQLLHGCWTTCRYLMGNRWSKPISPHFWQWTQHLWIQMPNDNMTDGVMYPRTAYMSTLSNMWKWTMNSVV